VLGEVWFDHQWGDFEAAKLRWNWFALQLTDGADIMIFELFDRQGKPVQRMGTYARNGTVSALGDGDIALSSSGTWKSPSSGVSYPLDWTSRFRRKACSYRWIRSSARASLMPARRR
jgi:predicted secreted hydrolase